MTYNVQYRGGPSIIQFVFTHTHTHSNTYYRASTILQSPPVALNIIGHGGHRSCTHTASRGAISRTSTRAPCLSSHHLYFWVRVSPRGTGLNDTCVTCVSASLAPSHLHTCAHVVVVSVVQGGGEQLSYMGGTARVQGMQRRTNGRIFGTPARPRRPADRNHPRTLCHGALTPVPRRAAILLGAP